MMYSHLELRVMVCRLSLLLMLLMLVYKRRKKVCVRVLMENCNKVLRALV